MNILKYIYTMFTVAYGVKFTKIFEADDNIKLWLQIWSESLLCFSNDIIIKSAKQCILTLDWPPSLAEFIKICNENSGIPSVEQVIELCVRKDLSHPIAQEVYAKVGSWNFKNDSSKDLHDKICKIYPDLVNNYNEQEKIRKIRNENIKLVDSDININQY